MKKLLLLTSMLLVVLCAKSQTITSIDFFKWSDPITYELSQEPYISGYGYYSDSLSNVFENKDFYEYNNEYYCIESWADYYYWYTKKYWHLFDNPAVYEYYYWTKNDLGMASYIASYRYRGEYYPSTIKLIFKDETIPNRLSSNKFIAINDRQIKRMKDQKQYPKIETNQKMPNQRPVSYSDRGINSNSGRRTSVQPATRSTSVVTSKPQTQSNHSK